MNLSRIRLRLTLGYVGIFALIFLLVGVVAVVGFWRELVSQQDVLLTQEARNTARNILEDNERALLATEYEEYSWVALDLDGRVLDQNSSAESLGLPSSELAERTLREDEPVSATIEGQPGSVRAVGIPFYDDSGELIGAIQYATSLQAVRQTLNQLVLVLLPLGLGGLGLAAIGGSYMAGRAVQPVQNAFEKQRAFIADASHELKTPVTLMRADAEVLFRGLKNSDDRELAEDIIGESERISEILSNLLTMARLDAGALDVSLQPFDLSTVLMETAERFRARSASEAIQLETQVPGKLPVRGDPVTTGQILSALLDNALRFTPSGGHVSLTSGLQDGWVEVVVKDTGPGIDPEHLPRIFDRFYRASVGRSRETGGTGLGLSIACGLARAQNGDLTAENAKDGGAVFRLKLPRS